LESGDGEKRGGEGERGREGEGPTKFKVVT
jgi:hypothetical protein